MKFPVKCLVPVIVFGISTPTFAALSDFIEYNFDRYNNGMEQNSNDLPGRLFIPTNYNANPNTYYPVVIYYHGLGQQGSEDAAGDGVWNTAQLGGTDQLLAQAKANGYFLYAPQTWGGWGTDAIDNSLNQLRKMASDYRIDTSRMYVTGISLGGGATIDAIARYPQVFAAGTNMSGSDVSNISTTNYGNRLKDTPLWIFQGYNDATVGRAVPRTRFNLIRAAKGEANIVFPNDGASAAATVSPNGNGVDVNYPSTGNNRARYWQTADGLTRYTEYATGGHGIAGRAYNEAAQQAWFYSKTRTIPKLDVGQTVKFDPGFYQLTTTNATGFMSTGPGGEVWNSTTYGIWSVLGPAHSFLKDTTGKGTDVGIEITDRFNNEYTLPGGATTVDQRLNQDGWIVTNGDPGGLRITGLNPGWKYTVEFFSSFTSSGTTRFIIDGVSKDIAHLNNVSNTVLFEDIVANGTGAIDILVTSPSGTGYFNWLSITGTAVPEPAALSLLAPALFGLIARRRRPVRST